MRPTRRRAAAVAAAAVARADSPSSISSDANEMDSEVDVAMSEVFSSEDELEEEEDDVQPMAHDVLDNNDGMESLSEQEVDEDDEGLEDNDEEDDEEEEEEEEEEEIIQPIKNTARKPNKPKKKPAIIESEEEEDEFSEEEAPPKNTAIKSSNKRKKPVVESDEEGFSDDDAEIVRNKPMTKRQRAKVYQEIPEEYLELPMDTGKKKLLTEEEEQLKKSEVARRRKNQSLQRAEKDKADTINRLLKKQASKSKKIIEDTEDKETPHEKLMKSEDPNRIRYVNTSKGSQLSIPSVYTIDQIFGETNHHTSPKEVKKCEVQGCLKNRKYTAKKSGKSVCSLDHYKLVEAK